MASSERRPWANRNAIALMAMNLFRGIGVGGMQALFSLYMASLGYTMKSIGGVITLASIFAAVSLPLVGALIEHYGPRRITALTGALIALSLGVLSLEPSLWIFAASYFLFMLSFFYGQPARMTFLANSIPSSVLGTSVGIVTAVFTASRIAGPTLGGIGAEKLGFRSTFLLLSILSAIGVILFIALSSETEKHRKTRLLDKIRESYREILHPTRRDLHRLFVIVAVDRLAWGMWLPLLSAHLYKSGFSEIEVGLLLSLQGAITTLTLPLAGMAVDKIQARIGMALSEFFGVAAAILLISPDTWFIASIAMILFGLAISTWIPSYNVIIARITGNKGLGATYAQANTYRSIASSVSPYMGGLVYDIVGALATFSISALLMCLVAIYIIRSRIGE